jgi:hypothetical protein
MGESFTISFQGSDAVSTIIDDIKGKIDDLKKEATEEQDDQRPEIVITSFGAENGVEEFLMDVLEQIRVHTLRDEPTFSEAL